jgi:tetratricopeptide repeat protein 21B
MARRTPSAVEAATGRLTRLLETNPDFVPGLLALATAFTITKQTPKARNQLKRIVKLPYNGEQWTDFVKAWLLLADVFIETSKFDHASELCKRALQFDASCARAWEYLGMICEKEAAYADAADCYEKAWKFDGEASAPIGYKLAFNYLKARRLVRAIDVSQKVLAAYPDYAAIKRDVLDVARALVRT